MTRRSGSVLVVLGLAFALGVFPQPARAQGPSVTWVPGPTTVDLGSNVAQVTLGEGHRFVGAQDTQRILEAMGNTVDHTEVGLITPRQADQDWLMVFEYKAEGYVKDDDKDKIDKDAILKSYQEGTEAANKTRKEKGIPGLHVTGWFEEPHYDQRTHNLVWALRAKSDDGSEVVNYNVRLLGREGYVSITLVDDPAKLASSKPEVDKVLSGFSYKRGKTYAEWVPGDKVAKYGLTALVAGGAGAAAAKLGLFAALAKALGKAGKGIVVLLVAVAAFAKKIWSRLSGERDA